MIAGPKKPRISRKALIITLSGLLLIAVGSIVTWIVWSNALRGDYSSKTASFKAQASQDLMQKVANIKDAQGSTGVREGLMNLASAADSLKGKLPAEPSILGVTVVAKDAKEKQQQIVDKATALAAELTKSQAILAYQEKIVSALNDVRTKNGKNLDELKALPGVWQAAIDTVKSIQPPEQTSTFHTNLLTSLESVKATLDTLPTLYEKKDTAGFAAKQKELESKVAGLKELSHVLDDITKQQDIQLGNLLQELRKVLQ